MAVIWFWILLVIWVVLIILHSYKGSKVSGSLEDYSVPRGKLSAVDLAFSTAATQASPATLMGVAGFAYAGGVSGLWWLIGVPLAFTIGLAVSGKTFRRMGVSYGSLSVPDWFGKRFASDTLRVLVGVLYLMQIFYLIGQFNGIGQVFHVITGTPYATAVVLSVLIVALYTFFGGNYAVVKTDVIQGVFMVIAVAVVALSGIWLFGGFSEIHSGLAKQSPDLVAIFNPKFPIFNGLVAVLGFSLFQGLFCTQPHIANRFLMLKDEKEFPKFILLSGLIIFIFSLSVFAGIYARVLLPDLKMADQASLTLAQRYFPGIFTAVFALGILSAAISTADSILAAMATIMGHDIYRRVFRRHDMHSTTTHRNALWVGRITVLIVCLIAGYFSIKPASFIAVVSALGIYGYFAGAAGPILLALFWRGATKWGAIATVVLGPAFYLYLYYGKIITNVFVTGAVATIFGAAVMLVVSLISPKLSNSVVDEAFRYAGGENVTG